MAFIFVARSAAQPPAAHQDLNAAQAALYLPAAATAAAVASPALAADITPCTPDTPLMTADSVPTASPSASNVAVRPAIEVTDPTSSVTAPALAATAADLAAL